MSIYEAVQENVPHAIVLMHHSVDKHDVVTVASLGNTADPSGKVVNLIQSQFTIVIPGMYRDLFLMVANSLRKLTIKLSEKDLFTATAGDNGVSEYEDWFVPKFKAIDFERKISDIDFFVANITFLVHNALSLGTKRGKENSSEAEVVISEISRFANAYLKRTIDELRKNTKELHEYAIAKSDLDSLALVEDVETIMAKVGVNTDMCERMKQFVAKHDALFYDGADLIVRARDSYRAYLVETRDWATPLQDIFNGNEEVVLKMSIPAKEANSRIKQSVYAILQEIDLMEDYALHELKTPDSPLGATEETEKDTTNGPINKAPVPVQPMPVSNATVNNPVLPILNPQPAQVAPAQQPQPEPNTDAALTVIAGGAGLNLVSDVRVTDGLTMSSAPSGGVKIGGGLGGGSNAGGLLGGNSSGGQVGKILAEIRSQQSGGLGGRHNAGDAYNDDRHTKLVNAWDEAQVIAYAVDAYKAAAYQQVDQALKIATYVAAWAASKGGSDQDAVLSQLNNVMRSRSIPPVLFTMSITVEQIKNVIVKHLSDRPKKTLLKSAANYYIS
ncbi:hypothetical protein SPFM20_00204 [Salmonella phage SPFM20]|nr:hypothetical protein SPFM20_00204 [Salmonella phage SPFM20]